MSALYIGQSLTVAVRFSFGRENLKDVAKDARAESLSWKIYMKIGREFLPIDVIVQRFRKNFEMWEFELKSGIVIIRKFSEFMIRWLKLIIV